MEAKERAIHKKTIQQLRIEIKTLKRDLKRCREALSEICYPKCAQCGTKNSLFVRMKELGKEKWVCIKCLKEIW